MKVLVIRFSSIGDIVLTTPVVRCLKLQRPDVRLHYLTKLNFASILSPNPHIDKLHFLADDLEAVVAELKKEKFDLVVDLHNNLRTLRIKKALQVPAKSFPKLNIEKWLYTNLKVNLLPDVGIVERYLRTVEHLGIKNDGRGLDYFLPEHGRLTTDDIPMSHWGGYVGCVIGGSYATKQLPAHKWVDFCKAVPYPVILMGGPEDRAMGNEIAEFDPVKVYNACGKFSLTESAELVDGARVVVSNDTGLMHIAAAFKKPIVSLWGNTTPEMGMYPYYGYNNLTKIVEPRLTLLENKDLWCRPCSKLGSKKCPKGHFKCMNDLDMQIAVAAVEGYWTVAKGG